MQDGPKKIEDVPPYFLGSIVLIKSDTHPNADVVDGQQRLTTLTILLSAIRANVSTGGSDITTLLYEKGSQIHGTHDRYRLSLRPRDEEFFKTNVQKEDGFAKLLTLNNLTSDSQRNIQSNAVFFDAKLKEMEEYSRLALAQFIVTRCFLVTVSTPDLDSAYRIFSVLNSRGLDLSPTDIFKARILGQVEPVKRDYYNKKWEDVEENLGRGLFNDLFSHIRMVYRKAKPKGTLLKEFGEHVMDGVSPSKLIDEIILPMAEAYQDITDAAYSSTEHADNVNTSLRWLNKLEFNDWMPPALAFTVRQRHNPAKMDAFFRDLERLAYSMLITKMGVNDRIDRFSRLTKEIESGAELSAETSSLQLDPLAQFATYTRLNGPLYEQLAARARSSVLLRLDALMSGGGAVYDYETVSVEHVLPQTPQAGSKWLQWFPDDLQRSTVVHTLGNLALLTRKKNSADSNYEFDKKEDAYFAKGGVSPFVLTTQVLNNAQWTPATVNLRQEELMARLEKHWRLENRKSVLTALSVQS